MHRPPDHDTPAHVRERQATLLRIALLAGVVLFGALTWFLHRDPRWQPRPPETMAAMRTATYVVWAAAVIGVLIMRGVHARARDDTRQSTALLGWALGESVALFGAVYYFMTDEPWRYLYGLMFMLATFILFPVRRH